MRNSIFAMSKIGINSIKMNYRTKSFLYRVYGRSSLGYSMENVYISKKLLSWMAKEESLILQRMLYLTKYASTTKVLRAMELEPIDYFITMKKLKFFIQLTTNMSTREILNAQVTGETNTHEHCIINEIKDNYLTQPIKVYNNIEEFKDIVLEEIESRKRSREELSEDTVEHIRYLLMHRTKTNNFLLNEILKPEAFKT
jgi:hypothetical protein